MSQRPGGSGVPAALLAVLVLAAGLRLIHVDAPVIGQHAWRQADTAAMARNFVEEEFNPLHPRVDWRGAGPGYVECEFPAYQFALAAIYRVVGVRETAGRLLSLLLSLITIGFLYGLIRLAADRSTALWSSFFFAIAPMPVFFGRAIMPESLLVACCAASLYGFVRWSRSGGMLALAGSGLAITLACLIKPHTLYLGLPLAWLAHRRHGWRAFTRPDLLACVVLVFGALTLWYAHAHSLQRQTGLSVGVWGYGSDKWGNWDLILTWAFWHRILVSWLAHPYLMYLGVPVFLWSLLSRPAGDGEGVMRCWLAGLLIATLVVARGTFVHNYYLLPATLPLSYYLGKAYARGLSRAGPGRWVRAGLWVALAGMVTVSASVTRGFLRREDTRTSSVLRLAQAVRREVPRGALVVAVDEGDPTLLYLSHRKGWSGGVGGLREDVLARRQRDGAEYVLGLRELVGGGEDGRRLTTILSDSARVVFDDGAGYIVRLAGPGRRYAR